MAFFSKTLDKLKGALRKTAAVLNTDVRTLFIPGRQIDDAFLAEIEERFIRADMGVKAVTSMVTAGLARNVRSSADSAYTAPKALSCLAAGSAAPCSSAMSARAFAY